MDAAPDGRFWYECDLRAAPTNVRSWESNGLNADISFEPFMTQAVIRPRQTQRPAAPARQPFSVSTQVGNEIGAMLILIEHPRPLRLGAFQLCMRYCGGE
jgi:hypothetical protein